MNKSESQLKAMKKYENSKLDKYLDKKVGYREGGKKDTEMDEAVIKRLPKK